MEFHKTSLFPEIRDIRNKEAFENEPSMGKLENNWNQIKEDNFLLTVLTTCISGEDNLILELNQRQPSSLIHFNCLEICLL